MPAKLIDGKLLSAKIRDHVAQEVAALTKQNKPVKLIAILVGDNPAAKVYAENQKKTCAQVGIAYELHQLPPTATRDELHAAIQHLNADPAVTGIFLHSPLPNGLDLQDAQYQIDILKDVEGVNPANIGHVVYGHTIIAPCTALAVVELIDSTGTKLEGANVTVVGASRIVGRPLSLLLTERNATVTLCHIHTKDTPAETRRADIVVVAVGKPGLLRADHIKPGAVVIDVGINRVRITDAFGKITEKTVGDVDFDEVAKVASFITPVPGGVGPMTVAMLLRNTLRAARLVHGLEKPFAGST
ncbi:MAG TPA: bifunctional 5,10-methylenetetrahydrofolate dehydrogenase/5,10-methenyltetrahydrofolate cyclohydrolase [Phycisphaerae bacterium]|nr:bifunctional 5,10-methylenetetrahydrofolate dehydrogenase/5,10-methenyltetrahydrofolate cyclohydrolase [Phycisphaerae bacterium]